MMRPARLTDVDALLAIEAACFPGDRITRRSFVRLLTRAKADLWVDEGSGTLRGYVLVLYRSNSRKARIYSIATAPAFHGQGVGARLLLAAEAAARTRACAELRLEIRTDNRPSQALFAKHGYQVFGRHPAYYEDGQDALRLSKPLS